MNTAPQCAREQKKQQTKTALSDVAARLFIAHGFDGVRMTDVARRCGVSEKTVYNYFATKEALIMDRLEGTADSLRGALVGTTDDPVDACLLLLQYELEGVVASLHTSPKKMAARHRRFGQLVRQNQPLRAYQSDMLDQYVAIAATGLVERVGRDADDPATQVAARALVGLWHVQHASVARHLSTHFKPTEFEQRVSADVRAASAVSRAAIAAASV